MRPTAVARTSDAFASGFIIHGKFPRFAAKAPAFATLTRIMTPCPVAKSMGIMREVLRVWIEWAEFFCQVSDIKGLAAAGAWIEQRTYLPPMRGEIKPAHAPSSNRTQICAALLPKPALNPSLHHHLLDFGNCLGRVEALGAGLGAVHDCVAAVKAEGVFEIVEPLASRLVSRIDDPAIGL
jgi:hypothetical protein